MGAWGVGIYENDTAADWVGDLEADGASVIGSALREALEVEYLDVDVGCRALAAADVIGRLRVGEPAIADPDAVRTWIASHPAEPSEGLLRLAERAVDRVLGAESELVALWAETDELVAWRATTQVVVGRLL